MLTRDQITTYKDAQKAGEKCEKIASILAIEIRALHYSTMEPSHTDGEDVDEESGADMMETIMDRVDELNDWILTLKERVDDHRKYLMLEAK